MRLVPPHSPDVAHNLPFIDEHQVLVSAPALAVWRSLTTLLARTRPAATMAFSHLVAAEPRRASGTLLDVGATVPGFTVTEAVPGHHVRLAGRHRFSQYALVLTLVTQPDETVLSAHTYARFPGLHGAVYRQLVIGSGAHRIFVRRLLGAVRRRAETQSVR
jgi:hypothetical protein